MSGGHFSRRTDRRAALRRGDLRTHWVHDVLRRNRAEDGVRRKEKNVRWTFFPPNGPTSRSAARRPSNPLGSRDSSAHEKEAPRCNPRCFFFTCGRWDLNPHDIAITRSLVLLVCQFRHFRLLDATHILSFCGLPVKCFMLRCAYRSDTGIHPLHLCRLRNSAPAP